MGQHTQRLRRRPILATIGSLVLFAGCGDPEPVARPNGTPANGDQPAAGADPPAGSDTSTPPLSSDPSASGPITSHSTVPGLDEPSPPTRSPDDLRVLVVDGVEVRTRSALDEIPEHANEVEFAGTLIDAGDGPMMCLGGVADSYPPQCSGPVVDGLRMGAWAESAGGVTFGDRTVQVTWPPDDDRVALIADRTFESPAYLEFPTPTLPAACDGIDRLVDVSVLAQYAAEHADTTASPYVVNGTLGVLQVSGDIEAVRDDLTDGDAEPCLEQVEFSRSELEAAQEAVWQGRAELGIGSSGSGNLFNRVTVDVAVADAATVRALAALVDDPSILLVFGNAAILAGT